ncbi:Aste57867_5860 [Aphanomyces stellatus]|uniref:Aste57867_5860 protein n=1 Tax=Aphanomyces stellatus TaxID=120398 RepID=A0A485KET5_9STRA|nr:hypothetical protein As57867_005846 [Aphanomyces stellatus]VFT82883.1 Aste57867_5860 [Aphanomyces stellatus]
MWVQATIGALEAVGVSICITCINTKMFLNSVSRTPLTDNATPTTVHRVFRGLSAAFFLILLVWSIVASKGYLLVFYSIWCFALQFVYFAWAFFFPNVNFRARLVLFDVLLPTSVAVALVVWCYLYPFQWKGFAGRDDKNLLTMFNFAENGVNIVLLIVEWLWSPPRKVPWRIVYFVSLLAIVYSIFLIIVHDIDPNNAWALRFLQYSDWLAPVWYVSLLGIHILLFFVYRYTAEALHARCHRGKPGEATPLVPPTAADTSTPAKIDEQSVRPAGSRGRWSDQQTTRNQFKTAPLLPRRTKMLWENYAIGSLEALVIVASLWVLCRYPPMANESYASSYALRPAPSVFKQLFYVSCLGGFLAVLVADIWMTDGRCLNSYTVWNFMLQIIYWSWSLQDPKCTSRGRLVLFDVVFSASILVAVVVWTMLYPMAGDRRNDKYMNWVAISQHGVNTGLLVVEFLWNDTRLVGWSTGALLTLFPAIYAVYAWFLHESDAPLFRWMYPFLKVDDPFSLVWYMALLGLHVAAFAVVCCLAACKVRAIEETPERIHLLSVQTRK